MLTLVREIASYCIGVDIERSICSILLSTLNFRSIQGIDGGFTLDIRHKRKIISFRGVKLIEPISVKSMH